MSQFAMALPLKTREIHSHHFDSTKWNGFCFRHDDIVVASGLKSGTVWTEYIIYRLLYQKNDEIPLDWMADVIWVDCRMPPIRVDGPILESISNRRSLLTHLPLDALVFSPMIKYIYIARDGRDVCFSLFNHYNNLSEKFYEMINEPEGLVGEPLPQCEYADESSFFDDWISKGWPSLKGETDGYPFGSFFDRLRTWWEYRHLPNIFFIHHNDLLKDLAGNVRKLADYLGIPIFEETFQDLLESLTFASMKQNATTVISPCVSAGFKCGGHSFINKGTNGRWRGVLSEEQLAKYDAKVKEKLSPECAAWLETGLASGIDPNAC